jgi:hypothetical protein
MYTPIIWRKGQTPNSWLHPPYSYFETLSILIVADGTDISLTVIGGGGNKGTKLEKDFEKNLREYNL